MKAPASAYARAASVDGALEMLSVHGEKAKLPFSTIVTEIPLTPEIILRALGRI